MSRKSTSHDQYLEAQNITVDNFTNKSFKILQWNVLAQALARGLDNFVRLVSI